MVVNKTGYLDGFFRMHANETTKINVLSYAEVEDKYKVTCLCGQGFIVHTDDREILFAWVGKLYVAKWDAIMGAARTYVTTPETEFAYTKREIARAKQAYELVSVSGYPSIAELASLVKDGNIQRMPEIMCADIKRAYELYSEPVAYVRGKMTEKKVSQVNFSEDLKSTDRVQVMYSDVMKIDKRLALIMVCDPLQLTLCLPVKNETEHKLGNALQGHLQTVWERGFSVTVIDTDPHK